MFSLSYLDLVKSVLASVKTKKDFMQMVSRLYPPGDPGYIAIEMAYEDGKTAARGKFREGGERDFEHWRSVALIVMVYLGVSSYEMIIAALLHDIVEDSEYWSVEKVRQRYGDFVARYVERMSKPKAGEFSSKEARDNFYHGRFATADRLFFILKLSDRLHNLLTLGACSREKIKRKIDETRRYYLPYAKTHLILWFEILAATQEIEVNYLSKKPRPLFIIVED